MLAFCWPPTLLFAQAATPDTKDIDALREAARRTTPKVFGADVTVVLAVGLGLMAILFFWAFFIRKRPKRGRGALIAPHRDRPSSEAIGSSGRRKRRKRRPDHPDNWGRNPTLGETGGLPPVRPEDQQPHSPSEPESPPAR